MAKCFSVAILALAIFVPVLSSHGRQEVTRLRRANRVFSAMLQTSRHGIPGPILKTAQCLVVVPGERAFALGFGGAFGKGVATCRRGSDWGAPLFVRLSGGSWGFHLATRSGDLIIIFRRRAELTSSLAFGLTLGALGAAAGPIGPNASAASSAWRRAKVLTYRRRRGVFAGASLGGYTLRPDKSGNRAMYGDRTWEHILAGELPAPASAYPLLGTLGRYSAGASK
jgi:lipid-binding SYLF domain-containing protein